VAQAQSALSDKSRPWWKSEQPKAAKCRDSPGKQTAVAPMSSTQDAKSSRSRASVLQAAADVIVLVVVKDGSGRGSVIKS
jgi:hypothetical protein